MDFCFITRVYKFYLFIFLKHGNVEFFYRLVNARDADEQTNAPISPAYAEQYHLPPQVTFV